MWNHVMISYKYGSNFMSEISLLFNYLFKI